MLPEWRWRGETLVFPDEIQSVKSASQIIFRGPKYIDIAKNFLIADCLLSEIGPGILYFCLLSLTTLA